MSYRDKRRSRSRSRERKRSRSRSRERKKRDHKYQREQPSSSRNVPKPVRAPAPVSAPPVVKDVISPEELKRRAELEDLEYEKRVQQKLQEEQEREQQRQEALERLQKLKEESSLKKLKVEPVEVAPVAAPVAVKQKDKDDDDDDDVFDMFADNDDIDDKGPSAGKTALASTEIRTDAEGYGAIHAGRILGGRYEVIGEAGKGVFSTVMRCKDLRTNTEVVVKVARLNEAMKRAGRKEIEYLRLLTKTDPENKYCTLRMLDTFEDQDFLCVVLEALDISLRETVYLYGHGEGLSLTAVRYYGKRVLMGLYHMKQCGLVHTDLKLDNLLVDKTRKILKVADFGSTCRISEFAKGRVEQLCPLWYRPPEIIVGFPCLTYALDMWCLGNILYELATGTVLFQGANLNDQLRMYIEMLGVPPKKMARHSETYFANGDPTKFIQHLQDPVTLRSIISIIDITHQPTQSLRDRLLSFFPDSNQAEKRQVLLLYEVISQCLAYNPRKRLTVEDALKHPFFVDEQPQATTTTTTTTTTAAATK